MNYCRSIRLEMLDLLGSWYVIEHVICEHNAKMEEEVFRVYMGDVLKAVGEQLGLKIEKRLIELIKKPEPEDSRTGDEIALAVIKAAGLKVK